MGDRSGGINRREFLLRSGAVVAGGMLGGCLSHSSSRTGNAGNVKIVLTSSPVVQTAQARWAVDQLRNSLSAKGYGTAVESLRGSEIMMRGFTHGIMVSGPEWNEFESNWAAGPEELRVYSRDEGNTKLMLLRGSDPRGVIYALTNLADQIAFTPGGLTGTRFDADDAVERPATPVRSVMRMFSSNVEDKGWFNDRGFWRRYLTMLATHRFNRFNLTLGLGYDFARELLDTYFYFAYPFLVKVPGYDVRATNLPDAERDSNLEMLRFISDETVARGIDFQLGIWTHAYTWTNSPKVNHVIEGLNSDTHADYCRKAMALILKECPNISGVTLRIHGESGVAEGNYDFWKVIFSGVADAARPMRLDLHAKGIDQGMIDTALSVGLPLTVSPKFWAEHMGLPYHQAAIRPQELPTRQRGSSSLMALSTGSRSFTRYGYGDLLPDDRKFSIMHRIWPGTQRVLLWGDSVFASAYARQMTFSGSVGCEIMEPLSFKGRKGSGNPGGRNGYADPELHAAANDFEKYELGYRLWGRMLYNPDTPTVVWQRKLRADYGKAAESAEIALSHASRVLPLFTTAHCPSAANNNYWPEMYVNMSITTPGPNAEPYTDTPTPRIFNTVSPLDSELFSTVNAYVDGLVKGDPIEKYSPPEVAQWLDALADKAEPALAAFDRTAKGQAGAKSRIFSIDVAVQCALARFFASKLRAGALYAIFDRTGDRAALDEAIRHYTKARDAWTHIIDRTRGVYMNDVSYGIGTFQRGHWEDRLPAIDEDIATMKSQPARETTTSAAALIAAITQPLRRPAANLSHTAPARFEQGKPLVLEMTIHEPEATAELRYRHIHQAEAWQSMPMSGSGPKRSATIPATYTDTAFPLQYYVLLRHRDRQVSLFPGLGDERTTQPYMLVRSV
jgi:hypothetical protein